MHQSKYNVISSANQKYWESGSRINTLTWDLNLASYINIHTYAEDKLDTTGFSTRCHWYDLYNECSDILEFKEKYKDDPHYNGTKETGLQAYKFNAIKFAHKTFPIFDLAKKLNTGWLMWVDSDVIIYKTLEKDFLNQICPQSKAITYLGRPSMYSECGFIGFNLDMPETKIFLERFKDFYTSGNLSNIRETHDSFVFDQVMESFSDKTKFYNLNTYAKTNKHPFLQSVLKERMTHAKGLEKLRVQRKYLKRFKMHKFLEEHDRMMEFLHKKYGHIGAIK